MEFLLQAQKITRRRVRMEHWLLLLLLGLRPTSYASTRSISVRNTQAHGSTMRSWANFLNRLIRVERGANFTRAQRRAPCSSGVST